MKRDKTSRVVLGELLHSLSVKGEWLVFGFTNPHKFRNAMSGWIPQDEWDRMFENRNKKQALSRLRKKKWLAQEAKGGQVMYRLSDDALATALKEQDHHRLLHDTGAEAVRPEPLQHHAKKPSRQLSGALAERAQQVEHIGRHSSYFLLRKSAERISARRLETAFLQAAFMVKSAQTRWVPRIQDRIRVAVRRQVYVYIELRKRKIDRTISDLLRR